MTVASGGVWMGAVTCRSSRRHKGNATETGELSWQIGLFAVRAVPDGRTVGKRLRLVALLRTAEDSIETHRNPLKSFEILQNPLKPIEIHRNPSKSILWNPRNGCSKVVQNWSGLEFQSQKSGPGRSAGDYAGVSPGDFGLRKK